MASRRDFLKGAAACALAFPACAAEPQPCGRSQPARYWEGLAPLARCFLCPHGCTLDEGQTGICRVRRNEGGQLMTLGYGNPCAVHIDPIEKKPLFHYMPGARTYSIAVAGCNMRCKNCQNWTISQSSPLDTRNECLPPARVIEQAQRGRCATIAYTYTEPTVWFEYMLDTCKLARAAGIKNVWVTCGHINQAPLRDLIPYLDAAQIDLKSFSDNLYRRLNAGSLQPVLDAVVSVKKGGVWVELSTLVVPQWTDDLNMIRRMCVWFRENVGPDVPVHFLRFHPAHQLTHLPPTPTETMQAAARIAREEQLKYVYLGNVAGADLNTYCPRCGVVLVRRFGYTIMEVTIRNGTCQKCGEKIAGVWS